MRLTMELLYTSKSRANVFMDFEKVSEKPLKVSK